MALQDMFASDEVKKKEKDLLTKFNKAIAAVLALQLHEDVQKPFMEELKKEFAKRRQAIHTGEINFDVDVTPAEKKQRPAKEKTETKEESTGAAELSGQSAKSESKAEKQARLKKEKEQPAEDLY